MRRVFLGLSVVLLTGCQKEQPIEGLRTFNHTGGEVRSGSLSYPEHPPAGGPHNALWQTCNTYAAPIYDEYGVASLERGALWVTYQPNLAPESLSALKQAVGGAPKLLLTPYEGLPAPIVLTVWNAQLFLDGPDDPRLTRFLKDFAAPNVPLPDADCAGGFNGTRLPRP